MSKKNLNEEPPGQVITSKQQPKTLGPVQNLEEHVHPEWWRYIFNAMYLKTDGDLVDDRRLTKQEVDAFARMLNLSAQDKVLDLCCGHGRHTLELARRGFHVEGLDRSHYLISKARAAAKKESLTINFREGDARDLRYAADTFDVVQILGNSFGYFDTMQDDLRVLREVFRVLKPWGRLLIDIADGDFLLHNYQARSWEWVEKNLFVCRERSLSLDGQSLISREIITHVDDGVLADQFYSERLYTPDSLTRLLTEAGFSEITNHGTLTSNSQRNQDLGMMERRIITTAQVRKGWSQARRKSSTRVKHVAVVMGDPNKPDPLKPLSTFSDEDFYTIDQLKNALRQIIGHEFTYLNNHDTLIRDLQKLKGKVDYVFNLCDEGFTNHPTLELHVAAILEMLGIPYTGSNPQCLAHCYDKSLVRGIATEMDIPVPRAFLIRPQDFTFELPLSFPVIVKPNFGDSSFGITQRSVAYSLEELLSGIAVIRDKLGYNKPILVEEFLTGKDLTVGIIGNTADSYRLLPIVEEDYSELPAELPRICGYEAKWLPDSPYWNLKSVPANLPDHVERQLVEHCLSLKERLACRDYVRFDWRLNAEGEPKLLEANPNPGWCWDGHLAKMAGLAQLPYAEMLEAILRAAEQRLALQ
jgi:D-alanine-D-alanine ligase